MMKAFVSSIRRLHASQKAQTELLYTFSPTKTVDFEGVAIQHSHMVMTANLSIIASAFQLTDGTAAIYVEDRFFDLPIPVQRFVVAHEKAHILYDHREDAKERLRSLKKGEVYQNEFEADLYAAEQVGLDEAVAALFYIGEYIARHYGKSIVSKEFKTRAKALIASN